MKKGSFSERDAICLTGAQIRKFQDILTVDWTTMLR